MKPSLKVARHAEESGKKVRFVKGLVWTLITSMGLGSAMFHTCIWPVTLEVVTKRPTWVGSQATEARSPRCSSKLTPETSGVDSSEWLMQKCHGSLCTLGWYRVHAGDVDHAVLAVNSVVNVRSDQCCAAARVSYGAFSSSKVTQYHLLHHRMRFTACTLLHRGAQLYLPH